MASKIRIGLIGTGQIGREHLKYYAAIPDAEVVAVCNRSEPSARQAAQEFGVEHVYTDFRELLKRDDINAVNVALHNNLHAPITVAALEAGKHVFCEKPMAGSYADARLMINTAHETGRMLSIQLFSLFDKEFRAASEIVRSGLLGRIYHARSAGFRRRMRPYVDGYGRAEFVRKAVAAGGALYDMGVYHIAALLYLLGNPDVKTITGRTYQEIAVDPARQQASGCDVEEFAAGFVRFHNGASLDIIEAWAVNLDRFDGSVVLGSQGGIRLDPFGFFQNVGDLELNCTVDLDQFVWRQAALRENADAYQTPQHHWIAALQGRVELLPTAELALNTMLISEGIYRSNEWDREVAADEVIAHSRSTAVTV